MGYKTMKNVFKNITPAVAVMVAGLAGTYLVYDNYFSGPDASYISQIQPAAGDVAATDSVVNDIEVIVEETTTTVTDSATGAVEQVIETESVTVTTDEPVAVDLESEADEMTDHGDADHDHDAEGGEEHAH